MSKQTEFSVVTSRNGAPGFHLHVHRDDQELITAIYAAAVAGNRAILAKQIERFVGDRTKLVPYAPPVAAPVDEENKDEPVSRRHKREAV